jgi:hypothetical protein
MSTPSRLTLFVLLAGLLAACNQRPPQTAAEPEPQAQEAPQQAAQEPIEPASRAPFFAPEIVPRALESSQDQTLDGPLQWNFASAEPFTYSLLQHIRIPQGDTAAEIGVESTLRFEPQGDTARVFAELQRTTTQADFVARPELIVPALRQDSTYEEASHQMAPMVSLYFSLPHNVTVPGEQFTLATSIPLTFFHRPEPLRGTITTTLERIVEIDERRTAEISVNISLDDLSGTEEPQTYGDTFVSALGILYFDIEDRRFHSGTLAVMLHLDYRQLPGSDASGPGVEKMVQHHLIRFHKQD